MELHYHCSRLSVQGIRSGNFVHIWYTVMTVLEPSITMSCYVSEFQE